VWTDLGLSKAGLVLFSHNCMQDCFSSGLHEESKLFAIQDRCQEGLSHVGPKFGMPYEKDARDLVPTMKALYRFIQSHGLEGVFLIVLPAGDVVNMFQHPALSEEMICEWIKDLTVDGVHDGKGGRLVLCSYDALNLKLSGNALLNSCSDALREMILRTLDNPRTHTGPLVLHHIMKHVAAFSITQTRQLAESLKKVNIRDIPGEDMERYVEQVPSIVDDRCEPSDMLCPLQEICKARVELGCYGATTERVLPNQVERMEKQVAHDRSKVNKNKADAGHKPVRRDSSSTSEHQKLDCLSKTKLDGDSGSDVVVTHGSPKRSDTIGSGDNEVVTQGSQ